MTDEEVGVVARAIVAGRTAREVKLYGVPMTSLGPHGWAEVTQDARAAIVALDAYRKEKA